MVAQWVADIVGRTVDAAGLGIAAADGQVDGAADLLVEQDLAGPVDDPVVGADAELAEAAGALIGVEHLDQELLALEAEASTTLPPSKRKRTPATSRPA